MTNKLFKNYKKLKSLVDDKTVFVALDTETTELNYTTGHIIEIGALKFNKDGVIDTFSTLINPNCQIPPSATSVNNITNEMVENSPTINLILPTLINFIQNTIIIAHNAQFDMNFINAELERNLYPSTKNKVIDTLSLSRWVYPSLKSYSLQSLAKIMKIESGNAHRAFDDARVCKDIFLRCVKDALNNDEKDTNHEELLQDQLAFRFGTP